VELEQESNQRPLAPGRREDIAAIPLLTPRNVIGRQSSIGMALPVGNDLVGSQMVPRLWVLVVHLRQLSGAFSVTFSRGDDHPTRVNVIVSNAFSGRSSVAEPQGFGCFFGENVRTILRMKRSQHPLDRKLTDRLKHQLLQMLSWWGAIEHVEPTPATGGSRA
jgi:hypothetical protein